MKIRLYNARIMSMVNGCEIQEGELHVEGDHITYVGAALENAGEFDQELDCLGNVLMPGFKDAHTHSAMVAMRSFADDMPLQEWLNTKIFPLEAVMTGQDNYDLTQLAILEYLTTGVTAVFDMYLSPTDIAQACIDMGMRCVQVSGLNKFGPALEVMEERYNTLNNIHPLSTYVMGVHAEYTCSKELLENVSKLIHKYQAPLFAHMSETRLETDECIERYGMTPPQFFDSLGLFDFGGGGYHCVYFTEEDMDLFAKKGLHVITNPGSNTKLASGIAPMTRFLEKGINVGIGTDGASSNNCLDMFREMFLVTGLAKLRDNDASAVKPEEVLKMATVNGARAMGLKDCDVLAEGKKADIIMIDLHQPNMQPLNNIAKNIVYSGSKQNVKMTMINGQILYYEGKFLCCEDPEVLYAKANEIIARLAAEA